MTTEEGRAFADRMGTLFVECSAKTRVGVTDAFQELVRRVSGNWDGLGWGKGGAVWSRNWYACAAGGGRGWLVDARLPAAEGVGVDTPWCRRPCAACSWTGYSVMAGIGQGMAHMDAHGPLAVRDRDRSGMPWPMHRRGARVCAGSHIPGGIPGSIPPAQSPGCLPSLQRNDAPRHSRADARGTMLTLPFPLSHLHALPLADSRHTLALAARAAARPRPLSVGHALRGPGRVPRRLLVLARVRARAGARLRCTRRWRLVSAVAVC